MFVDKLLQPDKTAEKIENPHFICYQSITASYRHKLIDATT